MHRLAVSDIVDIVDIVVVRRAWQVVAHKSLLPS
jgi:hypothetical protein